MFTGDLFDLTYAVCAVFVAVFAWERFNTPPSNRSSTRRLLYWSSCAGYIITALALSIRPSPCSCRARRGAHSFLGELEDNFLLL
jgi:hypothetical protein